MRLLTNDVFLNRIQEIHNNKLMEESDFMIALLDGGHTVDDGVASEIGFYFHLNKPIYALRTDLRLADNMDTFINSQIIGYIEMSGGTLFNTIQDFFKGVDEFNKVPA